MTNYIEIDPIPNEFCPHVQAGAEMTGGWYFAAETPPRAVGMCHECIEWCKLNLSAAPTWTQYMKEQRDDDERILGAEVVIE